MKQCNTNTKIYKGITHYNSMNLIKSLVIIVTIMFFVALISAADSAFILRQNNDTNITLPVVNNDHSPATNSTSCDLTIRNPSQEVVVDHETMSFIGNGDFTLAIDGEDLTWIGQYASILACTDGTDSLLSPFYFEVTYGGSELSESQSNLYVIFLILLILLSVGIIFGMGWLPRSNDQDEEGRILSINYLKYLRLPLWLFVYFLLIGILFLSSNIAFAFLSEVMFGKIFLILYRIAFGFAPLVIAILLISFFVRLYHDKQFQRYLKRGIFPQEDL